MRLHNGANFIRSNFQDEIRTSPFNLAKSPQLHFNFCIQLSFLNFNFKTFSVKQNVWGLKFGTFLTAHISEAIQQNTDCHSMEKKL
jgi:hypothetical protein